MSIIIKVELPYKSLLNLVRKSLYTPIIFRPFPSPVRFDVIVVYLSRGVRPRDIVTCIFPLLFVDRVLEFFS